MAYTKKAPVTDSQIDRESGDFKKVLDEQEKIPVMIAPDNKDPMFRCCINGVDLKFPKGQLIEVPESVYRLIKQSSVTASEARKRESASTVGNFVL